MVEAVATALEAVADVPDGATLAVGGFGPSGVPDAPIRAPHERGVPGPVVASDNRGAMDPASRSFARPDGSSGRPARPPGQAARQPARKGSGTAPLCIGVGRGLAPASSAKEPS